MKMVKTVVILCWVPSTCRFNPISNTILCWVPLALFQILMRLLSVQILMRLLSVVNNYKIKETHSQPEAERSPEDDLFYFFAMHGTSPYL